MGNFGIFFGNIKKSFLKPVYSPYFWYYFIVVIIGIGSISIWILQIDKIDSLYKGGTLNFSIFSFSITLLISSGVDILLKEENHKNGLKIIGLILSTIIPFSFIIAVILISENWFSYFLSGTSYFLALLAWWIANGDKELFEEPLVDLQAQVSKAKPSR